MFFLRRANPSDAQELSPVAARTFHEGWGSVIGDEAAHAYSDICLSEERLVTEIQDTETQFFMLAIAEEDGAIMGYAKLDWQRTAPPSVIGSAPVLLQRLYVAAEGRGTGIADALLGSLGKEALQHGYQTFWLECDPRNERAIRFYMRRGFVVVGKGVYQLPTGINDNIQILARVITQEPMPSAANR